MSLAIVRLEGQKRIKLAPGRPVSSWSLCTNLYISPIKFFCVQPNLWFEAEVHSLYEIGSLAV